MPWNVASGIKAIGDDLLQARSRLLEEERRRERVLRIHLPFGGRRAVTEVTPAAGPGVE